MLLGGDQGPPPTVLYPPLTALLGPSLLALRTWSLESPKRGHAFTAASPLPLHPFSFTPAPHLTINDPPRPYQAQAA